MNFDMDSFMSGKPTDKSWTKTVQSTDEGGTNGVQQTDKRPMKKYQIRMDEGDWTAIKGYCDDRRLSISAFIRIATKEYMERQGI